MHNRNPQQQFDATATRTSRRRCATIALVTLSLTFAAGCDDEIAREFRQAAIGQVETGVNAILDGVLDGIFAIAEPDSSSSTSTSGSPTSTTTTDTSDTTTTS